MQAMQSSASKHSYARHSLSQNYNFHVVAKPRLREAIKHLVDRERSLNCHAWPHDRAAPACAADATLIPRRHLAIADLGCSHGRNTLDYAEFVVPALIDEDYASSSSCDQNVVQEIQFFFSDLPSNDFNALFQSLQPYLQQSSDAATARLLPKFFAAGVPGSFYGRLFIKASLDLVICSYSLHWLSQVPPAVVDRTSPAWNGGQTWISTDPEHSKKAIAAAYAQQSETDKKTFLRCRAEELASGGILFLFWVTKSACTQYGQLQDSGCLPFERTLEFLDHAWKEMVDEGLIASEEMDMFNTMLYYFTAQELESALKDVPELRLLHIETVEDAAMFVEQGDRVQTVEQWVGLVASLLESVVEAHVGKPKAHELFNKLKNIGLQQDCFDARLTHSLVVASLQRL